MQNGATIRLTILGDRAMSAHDLYLGLVLTTFGAFAVTLLTISVWSNAGRK